MKPSEKLVLLLIGHGKFEAGKFQFLITTQTNKVTGKDFIIKDELEYALKPCQGDILIIRNSSYSHYLVSEHWMLFCPEQMANPPSQPSMLSQHQDQRQPLQPGYLIKQPHL